MPTRTQRSFTAGEIAPALYGRSDLVKFATGLRTCRNFFVMKHGGAANRPGSPFVGEVKDSASRTYFAKFVYSTEQTFVIEVGNLYFRFLAQGAVVGAPYELVTPYAAADLGTLRFEQSENVITITHGNYAPRELRRVTDTDWTLTVIATAPAIAAPANLAWTAGAGSAFAYRYQVTAVRADDYEESLPCTAVSHNCNQPSVSAPNTLSWDAVAGAVEYNVYLSRDGNAFGFIGTATTASLQDTGYMPQFDEPPPAARVLFAAVDDYPAVSGYIQQRRGFGATTNDPKKTWLSRIGREFNFAVSSPLQDDDAVTLEMKAHQVHQVRHILEIAERPLIGTSGGWWTLLGDETGAVTPASKNPRGLTTHGPAAIPVARVGDGLIYVQDRGKLLRDLRAKDGLTNEDLTLFAPHLLERYSIERMDYAEQPYSILWCVRTDGALLSLTYMPEHLVLGWARHDSEDGDALYEDVCVVPEGDEDVVYVIVKRTIEGVTKRYIERFASRRFTDIRTDALFLDSSLTYDGRNVGATTVTLSTAVVTAVAWTVDDLISVTASAASFDSGDVGNTVVLLDADGVEIVRIDISTYTSTTVVKGYPSKLVPLAQRLAATTAWALAVDGISGLDHLEGKTVGILADGNVVAGSVVSGGAVDLPRAYMVIHAGLPITADIETLDLDVAELELRDKKKKLGSVSLLVESSAGIWVGLDGEHLYERKPSITAYDTPPQLVTQLVEVGISSKWDPEARILVRQTDPLPVNVLAIAANGEIGG